MLDLYIPTHFAPTAPGPADDPANGHVIVGNRCATPCDGWIEALRDGLPLVYKAMKDRGVFTDRDFSSEGAMLCPSMRLSAEFFRAQWLLQIVDRKDFLSVLAITPSSLLAKPLSSLPSFFWLERRLKGCNVYTLGDLICWNRESLAAVPGLNSQRLERLATALANFIERGRPEDLGAMDCWLQDMQRLEPSLAVFLAEVHIFSDRDFLRRYSIFKPALQATLHRFRHTHLLKTIDARDPHQFVRIMPPEVTSLPIESLLVRPRTARACRRAGACKIGDLASFRDRPLGSTAGIGSVTLCDLLNALTAAFMEFIHSLEGNRLLSSKQGTVSRGRKALQTLSSGISRSWIGG